MTQQETIAFIGAGNMANSLVGGLCQAGHQGERICVAAPTQARLPQLAARWGVVTTQDNAQAVQGADIVVLAIKPKFMPQVLAEIAETVLVQQSLVVSVASGVTLAQLGRGLGAVPIVSCMPNTPSMVGAGAAALCANQQVNKPQRELAESLLRSVGLSVWLEDETLMPVVTALSGCGPAYFFRFIESLQAAAQAKGLDAETATTLAVQTALGAAKMALECQEPVEALRRQVTAPGGQTEQALAVMAAANIDQTVEQMFTTVIKHAKGVSEDLDSLF